MKRDGWNAGHGIGPHHQHIYKSRVGLFDVDYLGHINNAATLSHAEYARWDMAAESGLLQKMMCDNVAFFVTANFVRYRREVRPLFRSFQVETSVSAMDERHIWFTHNFRYLDGSNIDEDTQNRIRTQVMVQAVIIQKGKVLTPYDFFVQECGYDDKLIQSILLPDGEHVSDVNVLNSYQNLDDAMRAVAAKDDATHGTHVDNK